MKAPTVAPVKHPYKSYEIPRNNPRSENYVTEPRLALPTFDLIQFVLPYLLASKQKHISYVVLNTQSKKKVVKIIRVSIKKSLNDNPKKQA